MAGIALRQVRAVIAVCEEGSFTRAAERENATQSGISQHVAAVERALKVRLFERTSTGVIPTPAGLRYYRRCVEAVGLLDTAGEEARSLASFVTGELRIGLMPTFTRAVLAPTLDHFVSRHPDVRLHIVEGYSGLLTEMVLADELDFAVVPAFEGRIGLKSRLFVRDREMLLSGPRRGLTSLAPVRLRDCRPFKVIVPGPGNVRRRNLETYFHTHGVEVDAMLEMDAMIGTLELVACSDWVTVLPSLISVNDLATGDIVVNPLADPPIFTRCGTRRSRRRKRCARCARCGALARRCGKAMLPRSGVSPALQETGVARDLIGRHEGQVGQDFHQCLPKMTVASVGALFDETAKAQVRCLLGEGPDRATVLRQSTWIDAREHDTGDEETESVETVRRDGAEHPTQSQSDAETADPAEHRPG
jgi:LysR family nitrogen assimilation transcriptional regulator